MDITTGRTGLEHTYSPVPAPVTVPAWQDRTRARLGLGLEPMPDAFLVDRLNALQETVERLRTRIAELEHRIDAKTVHSQTFDGASKRQFCAYCGSYKPS